MSRVIIVGAGINGVTAAIELRRRGHSVILIDPGPLPHPLAASTDISKAVRAAYGADEEYVEMAERSVKGWRKWNEEFGQDLYHEVGFLFLRREMMQPGDFEFESFSLLTRRGHKVERITPGRLRERFPAWSSELYQDGFLNVEAGYVESGRAVATLLKHAKSIGVELREGNKFIALDESEGHPAVILSEGTACPPRREEPRIGSSRATSRDPSVRAGLAFSLGMTRIDGDVVVMAVGAWTPYLLPFTKQFFLATGHAVFHLKPPDPELFAPERFPVFADDISSTGYYGFPLNHDGVVKVANHGPGRKMSPDSAERNVTPDDETQLREFLSRALPALADAPIVYTRVCMYCDTNDGDFWIAPDPERHGLIIAAGDSGHGFKFAPILGEIIADAVEEKSNPLLKKFRWRPEVQPGASKEAARFRPE
jgi:glycine/D-amino acid oxidase-like deaminating enzyme